MTVRFKLRAVLIALAALWLVPFDTVRGQGGEYGDLFDSLRAGLFTVEVIDRASGNKNAQGSGFIVDATGVMATNYHVVSEFVLDPERFNLRYRDVNGDTGGLELLALDVLHDLALVRFSEPAARTAEQVVFEVEPEPPRNGDTLLALGNPYDIGISLVPGTFNGMLESQYRKLIHFTGAINPGMSGGPAVNLGGRVVGINVAAAGNSVSFLVPAENLARLLDEVPEQAPGPEALRAGLTQRIIDHQAVMIDDLLAGDWSLEPFGPLMIPREVRPWIKCSGASNEAEQDSPWRDSTSDCSLNDRIYLSRSLDTGPVEMIFGWYSSDTLNAFQLARVFEQNTFMPFNRTGIDDVTEFQCVEDWVTLEGLGNQPFKSSYCLRAYLDYPGLFDVLYVARAQRPGPEALFLHYTLAGVGRESARVFHRKFVGSLAWK